MKPEEQKNNDLFQNFLQECRKVIYYIWDDEEKSWEECGRPKEHIFISLKAISNFLNENQ